MYFVKLLQNISFVYVNINGYINGFKNNIYEFIPNNMCLVE